MTHGGMLARYALSARSTVWAGQVRMLRGLSSPVRRWLAIFTVSLGLFLLRFLVPVPVAQADNKDGPRLMCGLGLVPVTGGHPRFFRFAYFEYVTSSSCAGQAPYPSSQLVLLAAARALNPVLGLAGSLSMITLGVLTCVLAAIGIASLATGLRVALWAQVLVAAVAWVIVADAAFFDVFAGPFSEPAALVGLLLVAAGVLYLGRGRRATLLGLALAGPGGFLAILAKEQYLILAVPICVTIALAGAGAHRSPGSPGRWRGGSPGRWRGVLRRFAAPEAEAALSVALLLAILAAAYATWDDTSHYGKRLHYIQAVDMIFTDIVTNRGTAPAQLRDLGLPASWAKYAGHYYWDTAPSVRTDPLLPRYEDRLTDTTIARYLLTHPGSIASIGQKSALYAQQVRDNVLGDYAPAAGHPPGAIESRVVIFTWLMGTVLPRLGLWLYIPLWTAMAAVAAVALGRFRRRPARSSGWHRDAAVLVLCMTGCAVAAFIPPAYFAGISTTRHMVGMNLATALAVPVAAGLLASMIRQAVVARPRRPVPAPGAPAPRPKISV